MPYPPLFLNANCELVSYLFIWHLATTVIDLIFIPLISFLERTFTFTHSQEEIFADAGIMAIEHADFDGEFTTYILIYTHLS